jgi:hypothetical protein
MENNLENNQENFDDEKHKLAYQKDIERAKKIFLNKRAILIFILVFGASLFLADKYKQTPIEDSSVNITSTSSASVVSEDSDEPKETEAEKNEKIKIISDVLGNHQIRFADQDLKLKGFFSPEDNVMSAIYSDDILSWQPKHEITIYQYYNKISASEVFDKELLYVAKGTYNDGRYLKINQYDNNYLIILSDFNYDSSAVSLYLIKIFEKDGRTYKISYQKNVSEDVVNIAKTWVDEDYKILVDEFKDIDAFSSINIDYVKQIFNDSLKIKENLSKNNIYKDIKWETKTIKEDNAHADVSLEYPEFKGFYSANSLNKIITDIVLGTLENDRSMVSDWMKNKYPKNDYEPCGGESDYYYECSVNLYSSFKVKSIINDIISIEIILTDYTGGGNGNHSYPKTIIYDLKNGKQLFVDDIFCGDDYLKKVKDVLRANLINGSVFDNSLGYLTDEVLLSYLREASFNDFGLTLSFSPYIFTPGAYGIYNMFIPYTVLENNLCFKDSGNNEILIKRNLLHLDIPSKLSDSCGFMADNCDSFSFYEGKFNELDDYDFTKDKASISISFNDYKVGSLLSSGKIEQVVVAPYFWQWASSGYGLYVLKIENNNLVLLSRIDVGKGLPENIKIENNKIYFSYINLDGSEISRECYFNNVIEEKNLICN